MNIINKLVYIYLLLRPYYFFKSGTIQVSDCFIIVAFLLFLMIKKNSKLDEYKKNVIKENKLFLFFVCLCITINIIYYITYPDKRFLLASMYLTFNLFAIFIISISLKSDKNFANKSFKIFSFNIIVQFLIYLFKIGRWWHNSRYMGTFNDPNQFGYYILLSYCFIYLLSKSKSIKSKFDSFIVNISLLICLFLVFQSESTGMFLGFAVLLVLRLLEYIKNPFYVLKKNKNKIIISVLIIVPIIIAIFLAKPELYGRIKSNITESNIIKRVVQKVNRAKVTNENSVNIYEDRALDYIYLYPQYLIIGSGEGGEDRFPLVNHYTEIHSTLPALMFYYGIVPFILLIKWMKGKLKKLKFNYLVVYLSIIVESFTLANHRQALFWSIFCLSELLKGEKNEKMPNSLLDR